jgi:hypothetical protein
MRVTGKLKWGWKRVLNINVGKSRKTNCQAEAEPVAVEY